MNEQENDNKVINNHVYLVSLRKNKEVDVSAGAAGTVQTRYHVIGKKQLKEQVGFLVSKSLTLPLHPELEGGGYFMIFPAPKYIHPSFTCTGSV